MNLHVTVHVTFFSGIYISQGFNNNSTNVLLADPSESGAVPTSGTGADVDINGTDCITKGAPENTIGLLCQPAVLLLRYTVA